MKAVTCTEGQFQVVDIEPAALERGQVRLEVLRAGICGSDLHARHHSDELTPVMEEVGYADFMRSEESIVFGHEFSGRVAEYGPGCRQEIPTGADVVALPVLRRGGQVHPTGLSAWPPAPTPNRWWSRSR